MKFTLFILFISTLSLFSKNNDIKSLISQVEIDSLIKNVRVLSGEDSAYVEDSQTIISHRVSGNGNDLAAYYIREILESYGLPAFEHDYREGGKNIYAIQEGSRFPEKRYIICAHYDSVTDFCADDNASGVSTVLEAARILSSHQFEYTIIYALWDEEEIGLIGSDYFAKQAKENNEEILGVINFDMLAWDENNDGLYDIHSDNNSQELVDKVLSINKDYNIPLNHRLYNPGVPATDHASFAKQGFSAITFGEAFFSGDDNIHYHKATDKVSEFNLDYYLELSKLAVGTLASLAKPSLETSIKESGYYDLIKIKNYPNPFSYSTQIYYSLASSSNIELALYDILGNKVLVLDKGFRNLGGHTIELNGNDLVAGNYFIILKISDSSYFLKINKMER